MQERLFCAILSDGRVHAYMYCAAQVGQSHITSVADKQMTTVHVRKIRTYREIPDITRARPAAPRVSGVPYRAYTWRKPSSPLAPAKLKRHRTRRPREANGGGLGTAEEDTKRAVVPSWRERCNCAAAPIGIERVCARRCMDAQVRLRDFAAWRGEWMVSGNGGSIEDSRQWSAVA